MHMVKKKKTGLLLSPVSPSLILEHPVTRFLQNISPFQRVIFAQNNLDEHLEMSQIVVARSNKSHLLFGTFNY